MPRAPDRIAVALLQAENRDRYPLANVREINLARAGVIEVVGFTMPYRERSHRDVDHLGAKWVHDVHVGVVPGDPLRDVIGSYALQLHCTSVRGGSCATRRHHDQKIAIGGVAWQ